MYKTVDRNLILATDSYKITHWNQYPPGTQKVYSYLESRGGMFDETVFFGLQYYLKEYLKGQVFTYDDIFSAQNFCKQHFGLELFNFSGWCQLFHKHDGKLPLEIRAVAEGSVVDTHNVLMTIENTDPSFWWLTNYMESLLLKVWYPTTVATLSREIKKIILKALETSGDPSLIDFKLHDFGYRGVSSEESAAIGAAAHLVNFQGTDTLAGLLMLQKYYGGGMSGYSIPASEHSTMTSWGKENEEKAFANMLDKNPKGLVAVVSDSYDIYNACEKLWGGSLRSKVLEREGTVVVRPDSGDPKKVVPKILDILGDKFGYETNSKGYKVLNPKIRVIQGDGVNYFSIRDVLKTVMDQGWSADNIAFGMGGALLQQINRDTQKFAIKCSAITIDGVSHDVFKEPVGDSDKVSKKGRLTLHDMGEGFGWSTGKLNPEVGDPDNKLEIVFRNGEVMSNYDLPNIRERAKL